MELTLAVTILNRILEHDASTPICTECRSGSVGLQIGLQRQALLGDSSASGGTRSCTFGRVRTNARVFEQSCSERMRQPVEASGAESALLLEERL